MSPDPEICVRSTVDVTMQYSTEVPAGCAGITAE